MTGNSPAEQIDETLEAKSTMRNGTIKMNSPAHKLVMRCLNSLRWHKTPMQTKAINTAVVCAFSAGIFIATANAQPNVTWQTPVTISGPTDVSTAGALYGTWAPGDDYTESGGSRSDYHPVNGVTFSAYGTSGAQFGTSGSGINLDRYNGFASPNTGDADYDYLLTVAQFNWNAGSSSMIVSWTNMTPGNTYLAQFWLNDG